MSIMVSQVRFQMDEQGRSYSESDTQQLHLLGVERVYYGPIADPYCADIARLIYGECYIPDEGVRRSGIACLSRIALETALWRLRHESKQLEEARLLLLSQLRFDASMPYEVSVDPIRDLYLFLSLPANRNRVSYHADRDP
jgi:hypothetical protein